jgi:hypothetical protein
MNRYQAAAIHLGVSTLLCGVVAAIVFFVWYPGVLALATGGIALFALIVAVDVTLGPLLTLIIFKSGKKSLRFDLTVIALIQVAALLYGAWTMFAGRPAFVVFSKDRFEIAQASDLERASLEMVKDRSLLPGLTGPKWVEVLPAKDTDRRYRMMMDAAKGGPDLHLFPDLYSPYGDATPRVIAAIQPLARLREFNPNDRARVDALIARYPSADFGFLPGKARERDLVIVVRRKDASAAAMVMLQPWN